MFGNHEMINAIRQLFLSAAMQGNLIKTELVQAPSNANRDTCGQFWLCWTTSQPPTTEEINRLTITSYAIATIQLQRVEEVVGSHPQGGIVIVRFGWMRR